MSVILVENFSHTQYKRVVKYDMIYLQPNQSKYEIWVTLHFQLKLNSKVSGEQKG